MYMNVHIQLLCIRLKCVSILNPHSLSSEAIFSTHSALSKGYWYCCEWYHLVSQGWNPQVSKKTVKPISYMPHTTCICLMTTINHQDSSTPQSQDMPVLAIELIRYHFSKVNASVILALFSLLWASYEWEMYTFLGWFWQGIMKNCVYVPLLTTNWPG